MNANKRRARKSVLHDWLELLRLPNLLTVPGDVLAGSFCAGYMGFNARIGVAILIALLNYAGGVVLNDVADWREDRRERPNRPLCRGAISRNQALLVGVLALVAGWAMAWCYGHEMLFCAAVLSGLVVLYDFGRVVLGRAAVVVMASCRVTLFLLGATAGSQLGYYGWWVWAAAGLEGLYVVAISLCAWDETRSSRIPSSGKLVLWLSWLGCCGMSWLVGEGWSLAFAQLLLLVQCAWWLWQIRRPKIIIPQLIGTLVGNLILWQGMWLCLFSLPSLHRLALIGVGTLVLRFVFAILGRKFKSS